MAAQSVRQAIPDIYEMVLTGHLARSCAFLALICVPCALACAQHLDTESAIDTYINDHCVRCHGKESQKADRRFDMMTTDLAEEETTEQWQEILDTVNRGEMPPEDEPRPSTERTRKFVADLTHRIEATVAASATAGRANFRRLNRYEYRNTIRDLCGVNVQSFDPTTFFPADERLHGFENIGAQLVVSDYLLQQYLQAASASIDKASRTNLASDGIQMVFAPDDLEDRKSHFRPQISFQVNVDGNYVDVGHGDRFSDRVRARHFDGVPSDGYYTIRVEAEGINREHPYDPKLLGIDRDEPIKMEVLVADPRVGGRLSGNATDRSIAIVPLNDHQAEVYEFRTWMDKGFVPVLRYINGPQPIKRVLFKIAPKYHSDSLPSNWRSGTDRQPAERKDRYMSDVYEGPRMRIHRMELEGPEIVPMQQSARAALFGTQASGDSIDSEAAIRRFLFRAFRRPPLASEVQRFQSFHNSRLELGQSEPTALMTTLKAILCSPNFLYVDTPSDDSQSEQHPFRIASRLSYFLWSSMPDDDLFEAAARGDLEQPEKLAAQVDRMLNDAKANAFAEHFTDSWLHLNELGSMPPDSVKFPVYYERQLQPLMKRETQLFFQHLLENNLGIENFLDADFTFVNRYLADHYGISGVVGEEFQRVSLPDNSIRGGVLGQASVLTATSNGVETSPVTRGIWVLENILGTPPAPPPPDVNPLEPDIRGATTIREQLVKHRQVPTCAECHRKIDPPGFALESFDPVGAVRSEYLNDKGKPVGEVDTAGKLASGESFADVTELKQLLIQRKDQFAHCLTEKMLTYALGRQLGLRDRPQIDAIVKSSSARGHGLRDLVQLIVASDAFHDYSSSDSDTGTN